MTFKELRRRANLEVRQVAKLLDLKLKTIYAYECSARLPSTKILLQMKKEYNASDKEIMNAYNYHSIEKERREASGQTIRENAG